MSNLNNESTLKCAEAFANTNNTTKFRVAVNALAQKWCGVSEAFNMEQATDMLKAWAEQNGSEDLAAARMCAFAYGVPNITLKDAVLIADDELRLNVMAGGAALSKEGIEDKTMANMIDILVRHWHDFDEREKAAIAYAVVALEELNNDATRTT